MEKFQTSDGAKIAFRYREGTGPVVVFVHGALIASSEWQPQVDALKDQSHLLLDLRGHGQSDRAGLPYSVAQFADDIRQLLKHLQIAPAVVCGHSLGGMIALELAANEAHRVVGLILADTSYGVRSTHRDALLANTFFPLINVMPVSLQTKLFAQYLGKHSTDVEQYALQEFGKHAHDKTNYRAIWKAVGDYDGSRQLAAVACKTLIMVGRLNRQTHSQSEIMRERIADSELVQIERAGHMLNWDNKVAFNQALINFLDEVAVDQIKT